MAVVAFDLKDVTKIGLSKENLLKALPEMGVEVEEVTAQELKINVTPNRPDLLDFVGLKRAIENFGGISKPKDSFYKIDGKAALTINVKNEVKKARPYIAGMVVKNVNLSGNMLKYLINFTEKFADTYGRKRKKLAIGIHNLNAIEGDLVYTAVKEGEIVPLNSQKSTSFSKIMKAHDKGVTYQDTVPNYGSGSVLYPCLSDSKKVIALIPITNCDQTKVISLTKNLFVDITGTSLVAVKSAAALIACSFLYAGADVYPVTVSKPGEKFETPALGYKEMKVSMRKAERTLGVETGRHNVISFANKMGYTAAKYGDSVLFYIPPYRVDIFNDQDIIEDIAIAYGYDKIMPLAISGIVSGLENSDVEYENKIARLMVGLGYTEAINSMLTSEKVNFDNLLHKYTNDDHVSIADSKTSMISMLRTSLLPGLLQNLGISGMATMPQRLFEIGRCFSLKGDTPKEDKRASFVSVHAKANFAEAKSAVSAMLSSMGMEYTISQHKDPSFIEGRCAKAVSKGKEVCVFGEIHPNVLKNFGIEEPVVAAEMIVKEEVQY